jgi:hypothetical protein
MFVANNPTNIALYDVAPNTEALRAFLQYSVEWLCHNTFCFCQCLLYSSVAAASAHRNSELAETYFSEYNDLGFDTVFSCKGLP